MKVPNAFSRVRQVETEEAAGSQPPPSPMFESLPDRIGLLFQEADTDGNGTLSRMEFQQVRILFDVTLFRLRLEILAPGQR